MINTEIHIQVRGNSMVIEEAGSDRVKFSLNTDSFEGAAESIGQAVSDYLNGFDPAPVSKS